MEWIFATPTMGLKRCFSREGNHVVQRPDLGHADMGEERTSLRGAAESFGFSVVAVVALLLIFLPEASARVFDDSIYSNSGWAFIDKFVFDQTGGAVVRWEILMGDGREDPFYSQTESTVACKSCYSNLSTGETVPCSSQVDSAAGLVFSNCASKPAPAARLLFYDDSWASKAESGGHYWWAESGGNYWSFADFVEDWQLTCADRVAFASEKIRLEKGIMNAGEIKVSESKRPHTWYIALADCSQTDITAQVKVALLNNGHQDETYARHFSVDEMGIFEMNIFFIVVYSLYGCMLMGMMKDFSDKQLLHPLHWGIFASYLMYLGSHCCECAHWFHFANYGVGLVVAEIFAVWLQVLGHVVFLNVLFLVARGWMITTNKLSRKSENAFFSFTVLCIYTGLFLSEMSKERYENSYRYATWAGYMGVALNLILLVFFLMFLNRTINFEKRVVKRAFYRRFGFIFTLWFLQLPCLVLVAQLLPYYHRAKVLFGLERCIQLASFLLLPVLSSPRRTYETYSVAENYQARIASNQAQQRVTPMSRGHVVIPRSQLSGTLQGGLPPVNRHMSTSLNAADRSMAEVEEHGAGLGASTAYPGRAALDGARNHSLRQMRSGEGIIE